MNWYLLPFVVISSGPWPIFNEVLHRLYHQCRQVPKSCRILMESWRNLVDLASIFLNPAIAFPPRLCKYDNELCINLILIIVLQFYMSFMHWFTPVWGVSFVAADFQPLRFRHLLRGSRADAGGRGESWSQIPRSRCPCITIYYD